MTGNYITKILRLDVKQSRYREIGDWYHILTKFPGVLFDKNGYVIFNNEEDYKSHLTLHNDKSLHIKGGIASLNQYKEFTDSEKKLINFSDNKLFEIDGSEESIRVRRELDIILRKQHLVDRIKNIYNNTCQICNTQLEIGENKYYSEVHHIIPLGKPHNGKDQLKNMLCACPNCHVLLDYGMIYLSKKTIKVNKHIISEENMSYHNSLIVR